MKLAKRVTQIEPSVTLEISAKAKALKNALAQAAAYAEGGSISRIADAVKKEKNTDNE